MNELLLTLNLVFTPVQGEPSYSVYWNTEPPSRVALIPSEKILAVDGDTFKIGGNHYRLLGGDTPEISRAKCDREKTMGFQAMFHLRKLVKAQKYVKIELFEPDRFGRILSKAYFGEENIMDGVRRAGLARYYWQRKDFNKKFRTKDIKHLFYRRTWCPDLVE